MDDDARLTEKFMASLLAEREEPTTFECLLIAAHRVGIEIDDALSEEPISTMGLLALRVIVRAGVPVNARGVAAALGCGRASATELINRLVRDRFLERRIDVEDRRGRRLCPTNRGMRAAERGREVLEQCERSCARLMDEDDNAALRGHLARLEGALDWHRTERLLGAYGGAPPGSAGRPRRPPVHVR